MEINNNLYGISGGIKCGKDLVGELINYFASTKRPTFEDFIQDNPYRKDYEVRKFADKLKECVALIIGCTREQLEEQEFKNKELGPEWWYYKTDNGILLNYKKNKDNNFELLKDVSLIKTTPRLILQLLGTEGGRKIIHPNIWVNALFADYYPYSARGSEYEFEQSRWIITDLRFPENEGKAIKERNGLRIGVKRYFGLRFPEYVHLQYEEDPYAIPTELFEENPTLYKNLNHLSETAMGDHYWCDIIIENNGTIEELFDRILCVVSIHQSIV